MLEGTLLIVMPAEPTRALLLDLDGTLADSLTVMETVYRRFLTSLGALPSESEFRRMNGPPLPEIVRLLKAAHGLADTEADLLESYEAALDSTYAEVAPTPGARRLLERAKAHKATVGIVTSNSSSRTRDWLATIELSELVDFIVAGEDVAHGKPNAEPYLLAASRAGFPNREIAAVEDSLPGVRSASLAGLRTFAFDPHARGASWPDGVEAIESLDILADRLWPA